MLLWCTVSSGKLVFSLFGVKAPVKKKIIKQTVNSIFGGTPIGNYCSDPFRGMQKQCSFRLLEYACSFKLQFMASLPYFLLCGPLKVLIFITVARLLKYSTDKTPNPTPY